MNPHEEEKEPKDPEVQPIPPAQSRDAGTLSHASKRFDVGNKGYLDDDERIIRKYDTNNDGQLDIAELKQIVTDLRKERNAKSNFMKVSIGSSSLLVLVLLANFGLIWAVVVLTRQTETLNGKLIDTSTNEMVTTQAEGAGLNAALSPLWSALMERQEVDENARNLRNGVTAPWVHPIRKLRADHEEVRRLQGLNIPLANITNTQAQISATFAHYMNGTSTEANLIHDNGNIYSVSLASGIFALHEPAPACAYKWRNIMEQGTACPKYSLECCDGTGADSMCTLAAYEFCTGT